MAKKPQEHYQGRCRRCNRVLTSKWALAGIGPRCQKKAAAEEAQAELDKRSIPMFEEQSA